MRLRDKVAVVAGVDNEGIGQATAMLFAEEGARGVVTDIHQAAGSRVVAQVQQQGGDALFLKMDFNSVDEIEQVFEETIKAFGALDILVNNAAVFTPKGLDATAEDWMRSLKILDEIPEDKCRRKSPLHCYCSAFSKIHMPPDTSIIGSMSLSAESAISMVLRLSRII